MGSVGVSAYDAIAPRFERDRALPDGVAEAVRAAVLGAAAAARPRILDLGAGSGRIGAPFVAAGDDYVGADLSLGMLQAFAARCGGLRGWCRRMALRSRSATRRSMPSCWCRYSAA